MFANFAIRPRPPERGEGLAEGATVGIQESQQRHEARGNEGIHRQSFEEFVDRKNLRVGEVNFAPGFVDHGADVPPGLPPRPAGAIECVAAALPTCR
jgi:hypothetical protein